MATFCFKVEGGKARVVSAAALMGIGRTKKRSKKRVSGTKRKTTRRR